MALGLRPYLRALVRDGRSRWWPGPFLLLGVLGGSEWDVLSSRELPHDLRLDNLFVFMAASKQTNRLLHGTKTSKMTPSSKFTNSWALDH